jgi:hypothetical protein
VGTKYAKERPHGGAPFAYVFGLVTAAAAEQKNQSENNDPGAAIVKDVAKTVVVIHKTKSLPRGVVSPYNSIL